jgi:hypothetical protein
VKTKTVCLSLLFLLITAFELTPFPSFAQDGAEQRRRVRGDAAQRMVDEATRAVDQANRDRRRIRPNVAPDRAAQQTDPGRYGGDDINPAQTSDDPIYGYTRENPVKLGGESGSGAAYSHVYLKQLRDKNRRPFKYYRVGNVGAGPDGHITDQYKLTDSDGSEFTLFIDMYHPEKNPLDCLAPKGMFMAP